MVIGISRHSFAREPLTKNFKRVRARETVARMKPQQREQRLIAVLKTWRAICNRRGITRDQKDQIFEEYLIGTYGLHATARRDYIKIAKIAKLNKKFL